MRNFVNHCNRAITFQALQPGGRPLFIADQQHTQSFNVRHAATGCFCSGCSGLSGCFGSRLPAFIPYAKVKKLILTHYILFIWKDRCFFFPMTLRSGAVSSVFPMALRIGTSARSCFPMLPHRPSWSISRRAATSYAQISAAAPLPVSSSAAAPRPAVSLPLRRPWPAASS